MTSTGSGPLTSDFAPAGENKTYCWVCRKTFATSQWQGGSAPPEKDPLIAAHVATGDHQEKKAAMDMSVEV
jgi:hypothetical protein